MAHDLIGESVSICPLEFAKVDGETLLPLFHDVVLVTWNPAAIFYLLVDKVCLLLLCVHIGDGFCF